MTSEVFGARPRKEPKQPNDSCASCGSDGTLWLAEDGFWYCQKCAQLHTIKLVENEPPRNVLSAFVCRTTPAKVYEYQCRRPDRYFLPLYDAVYFAYVTISDEGAGTSRFGEKEFEAGATYEYRVDITDSHDGLDRDWLTENVLLRLTPTDRNWVKRFHPKLFTQEGFMQDKKHFAFFKKHEAIPVRWVPPGLRSGIWDRVSP